MTADPVCFCVRNLGVAYASRPALAGVDIDIRSKTLLSLVGPSGCGKSTFLNCLNRLIDLNADATVRGTVHMEGRDVFDSACDVVRLRRRVGMIFQQPNPFPLSIRRNLSYPLAEHGIRSRQRQQDRIFTVLEKVGLLEEVADRLDESALRLSGGQQQRLCIARALLLEPEILLLDEPCSALDPISSAVVEDLLTSLKRDYTLVVVTHNIAQARRLADRVAVFWVREGAGTIVEEGPSPEIFSAPRTEIAARYLGGQVG